MTAALAAIVTKTARFPPPEALTRKTGTGTIANVNNMTRMAPGRAALIVQPIHLNRLGTMTRGSALQ